MLSLQLMKKRINIGSNIRSRINNKNNFTKQTKPYLVEIKIGKRLKSSMKLLLPGLACLRCLHPQR